MPTFNLAQCTSYFEKTFSAICPNKTFNIPNWISTFSPPQTPFNLDPPTYEELLMLFVRWNRLDRHLHLIKYLSYVLNVALIYDPI